MFQQDGKLYHHQHELHQGFDHHSGFFYREQSQFAKGNNEWPVIKNLNVNNSKLQSLGSFKKDSLNVEKIGSKQFEAQKLLDRVGWK